MWIGVILSTISIGLVVDQFLQPHGQWLINIIVWALFARLFYISGHSERLRWLACLALASLGELVLCELFGLYEYRNGSIPFFVPPGHVLLYAAGVWLAPIVPKNLAWWVLATATPYALYCGFQGTDQLSLVLFVLWCLMFFKAELRPLLATMFILALAMEILGTGLGNWQWANSTYFINWTLSLANPPFAVGVFYCGLDYIVSLPGYSSTTSKLEL